MTDQAPPTAPDAEATTPEVEPAPHVVDIVVHTTDVSEQGWPRVYALLSDGREVAFSDIVTDKIEVS